MDKDIGLHVCCAPCLATAMETLRRQPEAFPRIAGVFFYNPNIHPLLEFRRRVKALRVYLERDPISAEIDADYGLREYLDRVAAFGINDRRERCRRCYDLRLSWTARWAKQAGLTGFSTTLLASREQDRDLVAAAGHEAAEEAGLTFVEGDFRRFLPDEKQLRGIYRQQYCGCIFSEEERFRDTGKHLYRDMNQ